MNIFNQLKQTFNQFSDRIIDRYTGHSEAVIVACYYNPQKSLVRLNAFNEWYGTIKHLNHRIIECTINGSVGDLPESPYIKVINADSWLWHKESILNKIIRELPEQFKYVFWLDTDIIFSNKEWLVESVGNFERGATIVQPFEYCVHMEENETSNRLNFDLKSVIRMPLPNQINKRVWRSFAATYVKHSSFSNDTNYDIYGHVGFAWGAIRSVLTGDSPLFDKGLIGGGDHVMALGAVGKFNHLSMQKSFTAILPEIDAYQKQLFEKTKGRLDYTGGTLFHIWHGDLGKRDYLKRIQNFMPIAKDIRQKDENGLYIAEKGEDVYFKDYMNKREVVKKQRGDTFINEIFDDGVSSVQIFPTSPIENYPSTNDVSEWEAITRPTESADTSYGGSIDGFTGSGVNDSYDVDNTSGNNTEMNDTSMWPDSSQPSPENFS